ncbi:class A beta-lactamase-related serine hydrolase [Qipengyuania flava]|uniref:Class A beta-lactamase-related serine hydrolase n=1 Tax=Qipengyuania flava TaxID=192812 RepID=A0A5P6NCB2_9SPHN|nr:class A beta-lactamase-related serine hydrolase [Qipengyuania flava]
MASRYSASTASSGRSPGDRNVRILCLLAVLLLPSATSAQASDPADEFASFDRFLGEFREDNSVPALSAVIVRDGQIAWEGYYGWADDEGEVPTSADTTYKIASTTKPIAATAVVAEALAGGLSLDLPMSADEGFADTCEWLSQSPIPFGSGSEDRYGNAVAAMDCAKPLTLSQMLDMRANGDAFVYNPIAYARIDRAILGAGGRDLRAIVRDRVAEPAGMRDVALGWRDPEGGDALRFLAPPFHPVDGRLVKQVLPDDDFRAAAGIIASPRQIAAFDIAFDAGALVPPVMIRELVEAEISPLGDYRRGWWLEDWQGQRLMWHSGWNEKKGSALYLKVPDKHLTLIVLANTEAIWWGNSLVKAEVAESPIARRFLEQFAS